MTDVIDSQMTHLLLAAFGAVGLWRGWRDLGRARASASWPRTDGEIVGADLQVEGYHDDGEAMQRAVIRYRYDVGGESHRAERVFFGDDVALRFTGPGRRRLDAYPVGRRVSVAYDPADPRRAVLEPGVSGAVRLSVLVALAIALLGLGGLVGDLRAACADDTVTSPSEARCAAS
jgi:hypothetical protein